MHGLAAALGRLSRFLAYLGAASVVAMMALICLDVVLRNLFRVSWNPTPEIVARYFMVAIAFLPLSWLELRRQMISVELLDFALSPPLRRLSDLAVMLVAAAVHSVLAWTSWTKALTEAKSGTFVELVSWQMPVWHSYFIPALGFALAALACLGAALAMVLPRVAAGIESAGDER